MPTLRVNGQRLYYDSLGSGPPLLLMHGWMQIGRDLLPLAEALAIEYQVLLPDLPGYGRSTPPGRAFPPDFHHRDAALMGAFLDQLGLTGVHIMGFSDGGEVALLMPILRPDLCRTVTAWGAVGWFRPQLCDQIQRMLPPTWITPQMRASHPRQKIERWPYEWVDAFCAITAAGGDVSRSRAAEIACPLLLVLGENDPLNPVEDGQQFIAASQRPAESGAVRVFEIFKYAGHALQDEQPERFLALVRRFLRQYG